MASEVQICNLSLSMLGQESNVQSISPPDNSVAAEKCAQFYPIARDALLEAHAWTFNTRRAQLALLTTNPSATWSFAYSLPSNCVKPLAVYPSGITDDTESEDFVVESNTDGSAVLCTNCPLAELKYQVQITSTGVLTPLAVVALARLLSAFLAGAIVKGKMGVLLADGAMKIFVGDFMRATGSNANASQLTDAIRNRIPQHLVDR